MKFKDKKFPEKAGKVIGFTLMYLIFTGVAFLLFSLLKKIPSNWTYFHMVPFTMLLVLVGCLITQILKN